jgi:hypothetical protein
LSAPEIDVAMYNAVHCVTLSAWKSGKFSQVPFTALVLEDDCSSVVEYNVVDRVVIDDEQYDSMCDQMINGTLLRTHETGDNNQVCEVVGYVGRESEICKDGIRITVVNESSSNNSEVAVVSESENSSEGPRIEVGYSDIALDKDSSDLLQKLLSDGLPPPSEDWRVIDYLDEGSELSFTSALTIAVDNVSCLRSWAANSRLRRLKNDKKKLSIAREKFITKYQLSSTTPSFEEVQTRLKDAGKLLVLLDYQLAQIGTSVKVIPKGILLSELVVLIKRVNGRWFPASRRVIKLILRRLMRN